MSEQWIEMTVYNKLKVAILTIMTAQTVSAITIDPIQVQSGSGDLLYAEMKFSNANPNDKVEVSLADTDDMIAVGASHKAPGHLNFYTRRSSDGSGVIVITSSRPMIDSELNVLLKIQEGNATHLQQVKTALTRNRPKPQLPMINTTGSEKVLMPQMIVSEKDIALNLPTSARYQSNLPQVTAPTINTSRPSGTTDLAITTHTSPPPLVISTVAPPPLSNTSTANTSQSWDSNANAAENASSTQKPVNTVAPTSQHANSSSSVNVIQQSPLIVPVKAPEPVHADKTNHTNTPATDSSQKPQEKTEQAKTQNKPAQPTDNKPTRPKAEQPKPANAVGNAGQKYVVQANESLWKIASKIARETHQSTPEVMRQIKENNANAFIQGDVNRIRRGTALNLAANYKATPKAKYQPSNTSSTAKKQSGSAKYRLDQAEMNLVADNEQTSAQGTARKNTQSNQTSTELSTKVMTSREKTVKLQKQITQLATALQQKNQRIQLLNARLAQLQSQLQQQNVNKPKS